MPQLTRIDWPDFGAPDLPPDLNLTELRQRLAAFRRAGAGYDALVVYGDREHAANIHWLTGFDPRFEEALLVVTADTATLITGNECLPYTATSPLVQDGQIMAVHCASLSLPSQPREGRNLMSWLRELVPSGARIGVVGWKWFSAAEVDDPAKALDVPAFVADPLRAIGGCVENATPLLMHPSVGLRAGGCRRDCADGVCQPYGRQGHDPDDVCLARRHDGF